MSAFEKFDMATGNGRKIETLTIKLVKKQFVSAGAHLDPNYS